MFPNTLYIQAILITGYQAALAVTDLPMCNTILPTRQVPDVHCIE